MNHALAAPVQDGYARPEGGQSNTALARRSLARRGPPSNPDPARITRIEFQPRSHGTPGRRPEGPDRTGTAGRRRALGETSSRTGQAAGARTGGAPPRSRLSVPRAFPAG